MADQKNQGDGKPEAARTQPREASDFAQSGTDEGATKAAKKPMEGQDGEALRQAEQDSRRHGKAPQPKR